MTVTGDYVAAAARGHLHGPGTAGSAGLTTCRCRRLDVDNVSIPTSDFDTFWRRVDLGDRFNHGSAPAAWPEREFVQRAVAQMAWDRQIAPLNELDGTADPRREREVEQALVDHIQRFLLELGAGFAFVGRQVPLEVGDQDFQIDLLFYHLKLRCFVVVELKSVPFEPAFIGKLNLYLSAADDLLRHPDDEPTIGLLLCREKNKLVVEYALRHLRRPIGVAGWETRLVEKLPKELRGSLPTVEEIEAELEGGLGSSSKRKEKRA